MENFSTTWNPRQKIRRKLKGYSGQARFVKTFPGSERVWEVSAGYLMQQIISSVSEELAERARAGVGPPSLLQLFYRLCREGVLPYHKTAYKVLGEVVMAGKYSGLISFRDVGPTAPYIPGAEIPPARSFGLSSYNGSVVFLAYQKLGLKSVAEPYAAIHGLAPIHVPKPLPLSALYHVYAVMAKYLLEGQKVKILWLGDLSDSALHTSDWLRNSVAHMMVFGQRITPAFILSQAEPEKIAALITEVYFNKQANGYQSRHALPCNGQGFKIRRAVFDSEEEVIAAEVLNSELLTLTNVALTPAQAASLQIPPKLSSDRENIDIEAMPISRLLASLDEKLEVLR